MKPLAFVTLACTLATAALPAGAMTEKEASANLMYFAFAMKQGELCEGMGLPGLALLQRWEKKNGEVLVKSLRQIEDYAVSARKLSREQAKDVALGLFARHKESFDREMAPTISQKSCVRFGETLELYATKLVPS